MFNTRCLVCNDVVGGGQSVALSANDETGEIVAILRIHQACAEGVAHPSYDFAAAGELVRSRRALREGLETD